MLLDLISDVRSWSELETRIAALPEEHERGIAFEEFCLAYFALSDLFQFKAVYRQDEIPPFLCRQLGYPENKDIGIDGLGITQDGKLYVWQAKFRQDRSRTPSKRELSTFFTFSDKADWRITITNANNIPHELNDRNRQSKILSDRLDALGVEFFDNLRAYLSCNIKVPKEPEYPHSTQLEAIEAALEYFSNETRGQLILPCGTGKTLASLWIAERLGANRILVMVPSLSLMDQTLREWASNTSLRPFRYKCLCSDTTVDLGNDAPIEHIYDMEVPVSTDPVSVAEFLASQPDVPSVLLSTYQSSKVLVEAAKQAGAIFDLAIFDEAHRTTGSDTGLWGLALHENNVRIKKRLFMTATPRIYTLHLTKKAQENDVFLCSMDDHSIYGRPFYSITFGDAIERGHITDYKIVVICVTDSEVRQLIHRVGRVIADGHEWDAKSFAKRVALIKAIREYGLRKVFTFHSKVKGAEAFTNIKSPYGIAQVYRMLDKAKGQIILKCFHVNGGMSSGVRKKYMEEFKKSDIGIMSNARCLNEGIDVPVVDAVAFIDPKRSLIDIVQATGRALRIPPKGCGYEKEEGYIFIPVFIERGTDAEKFIKNSDFDSVWKVIQAMKDQDQRLEDMISKFRVLQGKDKEGTKAWNRSLTEYGEKLIFFNLPKNLNTERFIRAIYTRTLEVVGVNWDYMYGQLVAYKDQYGDCNVPGRWPENFQLGTWVGKQRTKRNRGLLSDECIERLTRIDFVWDALAANWEEMFKVLLKFKNDYGHCNVPGRWPENLKLSRWVFTQREFFKSAKLSEDRIRRLKLINFEWDVPESNWSQMFSALRRFKVRYGHCNVPRECPENPGLSRWVSKQRSNYRKGLLNRDRVDSLEQIGFIWDTIDNTWETNYSSLLEYKNTYGDCNVPDKWPNNLKLSHWVGKQRSDWKRKRLSEDRLRRLEVVGFTWDPLDVMWDLMYSRLLEFKKNNGHFNVPLKRPENVKLHRWIERLRKLWIDGKLEQNRVNQLKELGFVVMDHVKAQSEKWGQLFSMLCNFKKVHGHCKVPNGWSQNPQLAIWVSNQRQLKRKGLLSVNYQRKLDEIGFVWHTRENLWEQNFTELIEYKKVYGHCNVPHDWPRNPKLGLWVNNQRRNKKTGRLSEDRKHHLDAIGFTWAIIDSEWETNYLKLQHFHKINGHTNVPVKWGADPQLGRWVSHQRVKRKHGQLSEAQIQGLDNLEFNWNPKDTWNEMFSNLIEYKNLYGHCNVPRDWHGSPELNNWANRQRRLHNMGRLGSDSVHYLEQIGFLWNVRENVWEKRFSELITFKKRFGHCNVPDKWQENRKLGNWICVQRRAHLNGSITNDRIERLNEIGFVWSPIDASWEEMYSEIVQFKELNGHCHVPQRIADNPRLGRWTGRQRASIRKGQMSPEKLQRLIDIGFD